MSRGALFLLVLACLPAGLHAQKREKARLDSLEAKARVDSLDAELHYSIGEQLRRLERFDEAGQAYRRAIEIDPRHAPAYLSLSLLPYSRHPKLFDQQENGKVPPELESEVRESQRHYRLAFMIDPFAQFSALDLFFMSLWTDRKVSEKQLAKLPPAFFWARGILRANRQEWDAALADLQTAMDRILVWQDSTRSHLLPLAANEIRYVMAVVERRAGRTHLATRRLEEVLTNDIGMYMAHVMLAEIHEKNTAYRKALEERRRAIQANPDEPVLVYELGRTQARAGFLQSADSTLAQAMELNPRNPDVPRMLGMVRQGLRDTAGARSAYQRFLAIAPSRYGPAIADVRVKLGQLGP